MTEISFALLAEKTLEGLLQRISDHDALADLDADLIDGVLRIEFDDGSIVIINRQEPVRQLWLASPEGPAHFNFDPSRKRWVDDKRGETLGDALNRVFTQRLGLDIGLEEPD